MPSDASTPDPRPTVGPSTSSSTRDRILAAAVDLLAREGGAALTVRAVAAAAGCSTIGVYTHFGGKTGLVQALLLDAYEQLDAAVATVDTIVDPYARLDAGAHAYREWALAHRTHYLLMFSPIVPTVDPMPAVEERGAQSYGAHCARVEAAVAAGALRGDDVEATAFHLWTSVHGAVSIELLGSPPATPERALARFSHGVDALLRGHAA
ncbi:transcriptional regulator, TetR family [Cellulomonas flavigena DSM 20109]|uniref:Transcriptional regulator, TetR family n=1 Tax=Cellulomonas flavigena (strain ATCC 482 / DSM 20109 / BCRC 11376 / JCM 18109 / NBRC 3775 / NCIMB 8073 / NRS 134) TaxID=446466 RepID=D5ULU0_CELFN|nr:TetR/AcrR family transcriptional regulator [Cellulomonas flavigena]ADG76046.1 transcriptional regulator, TetR family [Cellulomonas flavigena DSM 20109]